MSRVPDISSPATLPENVKQSASPCARPSRCGSARRRRRSCRATVARRRSRRWCEPSRRLSCCRRCERVGGAAGRVLDAHVPLARQVGRGRRGRGSAAARRGLERTAWRRSATIFSSPGGHHVRGDGGPSRSRPCPRREDRDARGPCRRAAAPRRRRCMPKPPAVPADAERGGLVRQALGLLDGGGHAGDGWTRARAIVVEPGHPALPLRLVVALHPHLDRHQHADRLFLADLHGAGEAVVGRAVDPGRPHQVLAAEEQARGLRAAQALAAAVAHEVGAGLQVHVGHGQDLGGGVHQHGHAAGLGRRRRPRGC